MYVNVYPEVLAWSDRSLSSPRSLDPRIHKHHRSSCQLQKISVWHYSMFYLWVIDRLTQYGFFQSWQRISNVALSFPYTYMHSHTNKQAFSFRLMCREDNENAFMEAGGTHLWAQRTKKEAPIYTYTYIHNTNRQLMNWPATARTHTRTVYTVCG